ncbi:hypothetical protein Bbelb_301650 [Branchiostoma belcheri]|nr:hypothetical protein Bbelb_301650 [Branchiostoma belcheri]
MAARRLMFFSLLISVCADGLCNMVEMSDYCGSSLNITGSGKLGWDKYSSNTDCTVALVPYRKDVYITLHFDQVDIEGGFFCYDKIYICDHRPCTPHTADLMVCSGRTGGFKGPTGGTVYVRLLTDHAVTGSFTLHYYLIKDLASKHQSDGSSLMKDKIIEAAIGVGLLAGFVVCYLLVRWQHRMIREGVNDVVESAFTPPEHVYSSQQHEYTSPNTPMAQDGEPRSEEVGPSNRTVGSVENGSSDINRYDNVTLREIPPPPTYEEVMGSPPSHSTDDSPLHAHEASNAGELDSSGSGQQNMDKQRVTSK